ncbi:MAG TPA: FxsA family protein [Methylophilus sp.]
MRFLLVLILLAFPFAELFLLVQLAERYGWWLLLYLVVVGYLGLQLFRGEKLLISAKMMHSLTSGGSPMHTIMGSARNMFAGILLLIPGVMTDVIAVILLLMPVKSAIPSMPQPDLSAGVRPEAKPDVSMRSKAKTKFNKAANDEIIDAEFTEIKDE